MRIVILEDDPDQAILLSAWLQEGGHHCSTFADGKSFIRAYSNDSFDLVILDWMLPEVNGIQVLNYLRSQFERAVPVIFVTQRDSEADVVKALEAGADDYMTKPIRPAETLARVNAIARRLGLSKQASTDELDLPPYHVDTKTREVKMGDVPIDLTQKEYELALFMFRNLGRVISRGHLLEIVWGTSAEINTRTVDTHVSRIRSKLCLDDQSNWKLTSVYRHGYRLEKLD